MRLETAEQIIRLSKAASKDETRPHICGVCVTPQMMYSTDGHIGASCHVDDEAITENIFFPNEVIGLLKSTIIHAKAMGWKLLPLVSYRSLSRDADNFPLQAVERLIKEKRSAKKIRLDAKLLFELVSAMQTKTGRKQDFKIEIQFDTNLNPILVKTKDNRGIIMPVKLGK